MSVRAAPAAAAAQRVWDAVEKAANEDAEGDVRFWAAFEALGVAAKLPTAQVKRTGGYLLDVALGDVSPAGPADVVEGVIYGRREGQPANLLSGLR